MRFLKNHKNILSAFLLGLYVFVAFFAVNLHNHGGEHHFKDFHFQKAEHSVSKAHSVTEFQDCLSCHFLHEGKTFITGQLLYSFFEEIYFQKQIFAYKQKFSSFISIGYHLRGPPHSFI